MIAKTDRYLRAAFRRIWGWSPERKAALNRALVSKSFYRCEQCQNVFPSKEVIVDHKNPVVDPKEGFVGWDTYYRRMFCNSKCLQVLCRGKCHNEKTRLENFVRKKAKEAKILVAKRR